MARPDGMNSSGHPQLTEVGKLIDIEEAANRYGCQCNRIQDFIARGKLHPFLDMREVEKLRQEHLHKQISGRSSLHRKQS